MEKECIVVILNYKDSERAIELAKRCCSFQVVTRVIIVDNNSQDELVEKLQKVEEKSIIDIIESKVNGGFSYGLNLGINHALDKYAPEYILCANTDTLFYEEDLLSVIHLMKQDEEIALASLRMKDANGREELSNWKLPIFSRSLIECFWIFRRWQFFYGANRRFSKYEKYRYVEVVRGSFMLFKSSIFADIGFFDEKVFMYGEENIMCYKIKKEGYKTALVTDRYYTHNHIAKGGIRGELKVYRQTLNSLKYYYSEYDKINKIKKIILSIFISYSMIEWKIVLVIKHLIHMK